MISSGQSQTPLPHERAFTWLVQVDQIDTALPGRGKLALTPSRYSEINDHTPPQQGGPHSVPVNSIWEDVLASMEDEANRQHLAHLSGCTFIFHPSPESISELIEVHLSAPHFLREGLLISLISQNATEDVVSRVRIVCDPIRWLMVLRGIASSPVCMQFCC